MTRLFAEVWAGLKEAAKGDGTQCLPLQAWGCWGQGTVGGGPVQGDPRRRGITQWLEPQAAAVRTMTRRPLGALASFSGRLAADCRRVREPG